MTANTNRKSRYISMLLAGAPGVNGPPPSPDGGGGGISPPGLLI